MERPSSDFEAPYEPVAQAASPEEPQEPLLDIFHVPEWIPNGKALIAGHRTKAAGLHPEAVSRSRRLATCDIGGALEPAFHPQAVRAREGLLMKVAVVLESAGLGGIQTLFRSALPYFRRYDVEIVVLYGADVDAIGDLDGRVVHLHASGVLDASRKFRRYCVNQRPALVHANNFRAGLVAVPISRRGGVPVLFHDHGAAWQLGPHERALHRLILKFCDAIATVSHAGARMMERLDRISRSRIRVVHNGFPFEATPKGGTPGRDAAHSVLLGMGRLVSQKGHGILLEAAARLLDEGLEVEPRIIGSGPELLSLRRRASDLGFDPHSVLPGFVPGVARELAAADVLAVTSAYESFGQGFLEAANAGVPVVAPNTCAVPEIYPAQDEMGYFITPGGEPVSAGGIAPLPQEVPVGRDGPWVRTRWISPGALARAIATVLTDPSEARGRAGNAREHLASSFSIERFAQQIEGTYDETLERTGRESAR